MSQPPVPDFVVAGAARSGTTAVVEALRTHPQAFVTQPKEPHYFALHGTRPDFAGPGDAHTINRVAVTDRQAYLDLFPRDRGGELRALGEGSVSTLYYYERALPEIMAMNPRMRFVILLRDPVARAYSSFQYMRARGFEPVEDFLDAVAQEPARVAANWHHLWHYTRMSMYADAIAAVQAAVPPEQVGIWFHEDLDRDYAATIGEVMRFLDLAPMVTDDGTAPRVNISGTPRSRFLHHALWWVTRHEFPRAAVKATTTYQFRERVRSLALRREGVPQKARASLTPVFADDVAQLRKLLPASSVRWLAEGET